MVFLSYSPSARAKLHIKSLIWSDALFLLVFALDSNQHVSQQANQSKRGCLGFLASLWPLVAHCCLTEGQEASVRCCCCRWEAACWAGSGHSACLEAAATAVSLCWAQSPLCSAHSDEQKPPCCTQSHMQTLTQTHRPHIARPSFTATPSEHYSHSFLTMKNSTHGLFSLGFIIFIISIVLPNIVLIMWWHALFGEGGRAKPCKTIIKIVVLKCFG